MSPCLTTDWLVFSSVTQEPDRLSGELCQKSRSVGQLCRLSVMSHWTEVVRIPSRISRYRRPKSSASRRNWLGAPFWTSRRACDMLAHRNLTCRHQSSDQTSTAVGISLTGTEYGVVVMLSAKPSLPEPLDHGFAFWWVAVASEDLAPRRTAHTHHQVNEARQILFEPGCYGAFQEENHLTTTGYNCLPEKGDRSRPSSASCRNGTEYGV